MGSQRLAAGRARGMRRPHPQRGQRPLGHRGGCLGSTSNVCWSPSATSRRPRLRPTTGGKARRSHPPASPPERRRTRRVEPWVHGPTGGPPAAPAGGLEERESKPQAVHLTVRPTRSDSSQQASLKPGPVQPASRCNRRSTTGAAWTTACSGVTARSSNTCAAVTRPGAQRA